MPITQADRWLTSISLMNRSSIERLREHYFRLSMNSRHNRFARPVSDGFISNYAADALSDDKIVLGCVVNGRIRGVAEILPIRKGSDAEIAFSVEDDWQGNGIGNSLMMAAAKHSRTIGLVRLFLCCEPCNRRMQGLASGSGVELQIADGECSGSVSVAAAIAALSVAALSQFSGSMAAT